MKRSPHLLMGRLILFASCCLDLIQVGFSWGMNSQQQQQQLTKKSRRTTKKQVQNFLQVNSKTTSRGDDDDSPECLARRRHLLAVGASTFGLATSMMMTPLSSQADDTLFRPNPLTNKVLEQMRIWDQAEADQLKYGGELERGDAKLASTEQYAQLLVPILTISNELQRLDKLIHQDNELLQAQKLLSQSMFDKVQFKKTFNSFADNIYYSDPDRANVYLAGGAVPKAEQSLAYLLRNDILTNIEDMQAEVDYLVKNTNESKDDLYLLSKKALAAIEEYLRIVPPVEIDKAKSLMSTEKA
jgi:hypothetical protein